MLACVLVLVCVSQWTRIRGFYCEKNPVANHIDEREGGRRGGEGGEGEEEERRLVRTGGRKMTKQKMNEKRAASR